MEVFNNLNDFVCSAKPFGIIKSKDILPQLEQQGFNVLNIEQSYIYYKHQETHNITFVVQGMPLHETYEKLVCNLLKYGQVILSTWDNLNNLTDILHFVKENGIENGQNVYLQVYSTLNGLQKCNTEYVIKVRADEWYQDFSPFIVAMLNNPDKLTTHNMFFRNLGQYPYHFSDHVIGGKKDNLLKMFQSCKDILERKESLPNIPRMLTCCPEQWLTVAYMRCFYEKNDLHTGITEKMQKHFYLVPITVFKDFLVRYTWHNKRYNIKGIPELQEHSHAFVIYDISEVGR